MEYTNKNTLIEICKEIGTPVYAYDLNKIRSQIIALKSALPEMVEIYYSMKANPNMGIVSFIKHLVDGIELSSEGELYTALKAGVKPDHIIFSGPGKTIDEIRYAIDEKIGYLTIESWRELEIIDEVGAQRGIKTDVVIRINPAMEATGARIKMSGASKQFGIDEELIFSVIDGALKLKHIRIAGIQIYMGTQILDENMLIENVASIFNLAKRIAGYGKFKLKFLDLGGGFGIPYFKGDKALNMFTMGKNIVQIFDDNKSWLDFENTKIVMESGRYIMADSGYFITKVLYKKNSRGKTYLIVNGGANFHSTAAGIGRFVRNNFPVDVLSDQEIDSTEVVDIVGPLCTPTDLLAQNVILPICKEGDIIIFPKSGAYGLSASMTGFLSHPRPAEVVFDDEFFCIVGEKGSREDFIHGQKVAL